MNKLLLGPLLFAPLLACAATHLYGKSDQRVNLIRSGTAAPLL